MSRSDAVTAEFFDGLFRAYEQSPAVRALMHSTLDESLPAEVEPYSYVTRSTLEEIAEKLRLTAGETLVDLACGRGGPSMWVSRATGARLIGVDFSTVAVAQAQARIPLFGLEGRAEFRVGTLHATGLTDARADALMCVDSFQFARDPRLPAGEAFRVLRPGGRAVFTGWEPREPVDAGIPLPLANLNFARVLGAAGFVAVSVTDCPELQRREQTMFERVLQQDPEDDPALLQLRREATRALPLLPHLRRVFVTASRAHR